MKSTKSVFPDAKKHGAVKKDEALPHDNHDISKKNKYVQTMFKQCLNQGTQSLTMSVSNFFKFTCRSEHMMSMEQDRNGSKWITLRFYLRDTRGSKTYCNILPLRQQKSAKINKTYIHLHLHPVNPIYILYHPKHLGARKMLESQNQIGDPLS